MSRRGRRSGAKRSNTPYIIVALVAVTGVVGYYIFTQSPAGAGSTLLHQPVSQDVLDQLSGVSISTLSQVGSNQPSVSPMKALANSSPLVLNGKPGVLYMGAEYCPYCAAERWAMIVALDKFGTFTGLQYMQSSATDVYPNSPTFSFVAASYSSQYITFQSVEQQDRNGNPLQTASANQTALLNQYDSGASIPFLDVGNQYAITGSQFLPAVLRVGNSASGAPYNWTQIAAQVDNPSSVVAQSIDGAANHLIAAICKIDGNSPSSVCSQTFAQTVSYVTGAPSGGAQLLAADAFVGRAPASAATLRSAPGNPVARI
jgi:thiol-disulfide isomerase/thioredoxin